MKNYLLILMIIFFLGCAAQMAPKGGPIDEVGPDLLNVSHSTNFNIFNSDEKIIFTFNEFINPLSVVNSINIFNFDDYTIQVRAKKIILKPNRKWPSFNKLKITLSRKISDYNGNIMSSPVHYTFLKNQNTDFKTIKGKIVNAYNDLFAVALFLKVDQKFNLIDLTESDDNGYFSFNYLTDSKYVAVAIFDSFDNLDNDLKTKKYGFISKNYLDLTSKDSIFTEIKIDQPLEKLSIKSFRQINNKFGYALLDNGLEYPFFIPDNNNFGDSINISLNLSNRLERYSTGQFMASYINIIDTIPPSIIESKYDQGSYKIIFDEPISKNDKPPVLFNKLDTVINTINYSFYDSFTLELDNDISGDIYICNIHDNTLNSNNDTLKISKEKIDVQNIIGGNIFGTVKNIAEYPVVVNIKSSDLKISNYEFVDSLGNFTFKNLPPDFYVFEAFEVIGDYNQYEYFNGKWNPYERAARFGYYNKPLEVRAHWDIKDLIIEIK